jgi:hypothetical protein
LEIRNPEDQNINKALIFFISRLLHLEKVFEITGVKEKYPFNKESNYSIYFLTLVCKV